MQVIRPEHPRGDFTAAIFDFDGTLSLLRRNWQDVMIPMMVDLLAETGASESREQLHAVVEEFVMRCNVRQTIYQMMQLAEEIATRGGQALEPLDYKHQYHDLLWTEVGRRIDSVASGATPAEEMTVPRAKAVLAALRERGLTLYLASGTDLHYVKNELAVLELDEFFGPRVYGALDDYKKFSKAMIIEQIIRDTHTPGERIVGFGDGFVEIEEVKKVGGLAVGVASNEETREGINVWKSDRLIQAGADLIIGDYRGLDALLAECGI